MKGTLTSANSGNYSPSVFVLSKSEPTGVTFSESVQFVTEISVTSSEDISAEFRRLADQWRTETRFSSNITANLMHPAYQRIMAMGKQVLPLILKELDERGGHWFHALHYLVKENEDPVPPEHYAKIKLMREDWLQWGRLNNWL